MDTRAYVYILASRKNGTLYLGVTNDLVRRIWEHKHEHIEGFTNRYAVHHLVYYEEHPSIWEAIHREKLLKRWNRAWKMRLIEESNPMWRDLYEGFLLSRGLAPAEPDLNTVPPGSPPERG